MTFADPQAAGQKSTGNPGGLGSGANITQAPSANFVAGGVGLAQTPHLSD